MPDYSKLLDAETQAFVRETNSWYPADVVDEPIEKQRARYDKMCRAFFKSYPTGVSARDSLIKQVPTRSYRMSERTEGPLVVYVHGGGYILGSLDSHDDVCAEICAGTGYDVISVDYRLAPEHPHPAPFDDCMEVFQSIDRPVILCGDSAGACLVAAVAHKCRQKKNILGQVLIYPGLGSDRSKGSFVTHANAPMLTLKDTIFYGKMRVSGDAPTNDPTFAPLHDTDFSGLPPTIIITAECDPLASNGPDYQDAITAAGGQAICIEEQGLVHGYLRARHTVRRARDSFARIIKSLTFLGRGQFPDREDISD